MATAMASVREQNLQKSMLWVQQEHATTLKALHLEISNLQKKCSELTFKIAMDSTCVSREEFYQQKCEQLESDLKSEQTKSCDLESELSKHDNVIKKLTDDLSIQNKKHAEDQRNWKSQLSQLEKECNSRADTIVGLRTRQRSQKERLLQADACVSTEDHVPIIYSPVPPKEPIKFRRTPFNRCSVAVNYKPPPILSRHASGCRLMERPRTPDSVPDHTAFVRHSQNHDIKRAAKLVLPPIPRQDSGPIQYYPFVRDSHRPDSQSSTSSAAEIGTLAVDQVSENKGFPRSRHINRTDCT